MYLSLFPAGLWYVTFHLLLPPQPGACCNISLCDGDELWPRGPVNPKLAPLSVRCLLYVFTMFYYSKGKATKSRTDKTKSQKASLGYKVLPLRIPLQVKQIEWHSNSYPRTWHRAVIQEESLSETHFGIYHISSYHWKHGPRLTSSMVLLQDGTSHILPSDYMTRNCYGQERSSW